MKSFIFVSFSPTSQIGIQCQCMWMKRSSQAVVNLVCAGRVQSHRGNHISSEHLLSAKYSQSLHTSGILIFQARNLLTVTLVQLFSSKRNTPGCVCGLTHRGNQGHHHEATTEMQNVALFHYLANNGRQRQVVAHVWISSSQWTETHGDMGSVRLSPSQ